MPAGRTGPPPGTATPSTSSSKSPTGGVGIPAADMRHVFEPYFTTKGDEGTGLGLANVWRIATDAGGAVEVESQVSMGATFRVYLPAVSLRS